MDNRLKKTMIISVVVIFVIFLVVMIFGLINNRNLSYEKLEQKIEKAAIEYYNAHPKELPLEEENEVKIDTKTLVEKEYIKSLEKLKKDDACSGEVYVTLRNGEYIYTPYLTCDNYNTETLSNYIKNKEIIIENKTSGGDGLYDYGGTFIYRGENVDNYVSFAGQLWRILRIDNNQNIRLIQTESLGEFIWDDRYNINMGKNSGYNSFEKSRLKDVFLSINKGDFGNIYDENSKKMIVKDYLCLNSKNEHSFNQNGVINCDVKSEEKYPFTLPDISEYFIASVDQNCNSFNNYSCTNYNYLNIYGSYWSINAYSENSYQSYYISGGAQLEDVNRRSEIRLVTNITKHALYAGGDGSYNNPYIIG